MPDPLTVLLDAIWIEARWHLQFNAYVARLLYLESMPHHSPFPDGLPRDSLSGRNVFWVTVIEGKA